MTIIMIFPIRKKYSHASYDREECKTFQITKAKSNFFGEKWRGLEISVDQSYYEDFRRGTWQNERPTDRKSADIRAAR